jgi:hypothetical protein
LTVAVIGLLAVRRLRATRSWGPGSVLVELSVVEKRHRAVLGVLAGESVTAVAAQLGVSRQSLHRWLGRYRADGLGGSDGWAETAVVVAVAVIAGGGGGGV